MGDDTKRKRKRKRKRDDRVIPGEPGAETVDSDPELVPTLQATAETVDSDPEIAPTLRATDETVDSDPEIAPTLRATDETTALPASDGPKSPRNWKNRLKRGLRKHEAEREDLGTAADLPVVASARYQVLRELGRGGMGAVLEAEDRVLGRQVALKVLLRGESTQLQTRFAKEARVASQLEHPNIVPVYDMGSGSDAGSAYLAMRFVRGDPLSTVFAKLVKGDPATLSTYTTLRLVEILIAVAQAVGYAHSKGVVHRDIKPDNIMLGSFGEAFLMDFGLAKLVGIAGDVEGSEASGISHADASVSATVSHEGDILGTPIYMAPEQARGELKAIDERTDVYALGGLLYEMLTLKPPVGDCKSLEEVLEAVQRGHILPPRKRTPSREIPRELEAIALTCLATDKAERYPGTEALLADLRAYQEGRAVSVYRAPLLTRLAKLARRHRQATAATAVSLVAIGLTGAAFGVWRYRLQQDELVRIQELADLRQSETEKAQALAQARQKELESADALAQLKAAELARLQRREAATPHYLTGLDLLQRRLDGLTISAKAVPALRKAVAEDATFAEAHFALARAYERAGDVGEAFVSMRRALNLQPKNAHWLVALGDQLRFMKDSEGEVDTTAMAADYYRQAAAIDMELSPFAGIGLAYMLVEERKYKEALAKIEEALERAPHLYEAWHCLGYIASEQGEDIGGHMRDPKLLEKSLDAYQHADRLQPNDAQNLRGLAITFAAMDRTDEAMKIYDRVVELWPKQFGGYNNRALLKRKLGDFKGALADLEQCAKLDPNHPALFENRALVKRSMNDPNGAYADFTKAMELDPKRPGPYAGRGNIFLDHGKYEEALEDFKKALEVAPHDAMHWSNRGLALLQLKRYDEGRPDLQKATEMNPAFEGAWVNRGLLEHMAGHPEQAEKLFSEGIAKAKTKGHLYMYRGQVYLHLDRHADALRDLEAARDTGGEGTGQKRLPPGFDLILAEAYRKNDRPSDAIATLDDGMAKGRFMRNQGEKVLQEYAQAYAARGNKFLEGGKPKQALPDFDKASKYYPVFPNYAYYAALAAVAAGEIQTALDRLDRAYEKGLQDWPGMLDDERIAILRKEPRFKALVAKLKKEAPNFKLGDHEGHDH